MQFHPERLNHGYPHARSRVASVALMTEPHRPTRMRERFHVANIKSQLKRIKTNALATERNKAVKSELRTWIRKFQTAAKSGDATAAADALKVASTKLDKAVSKGVIHKNNAANKKSSMAKRAASLK
jgi:small subunit ribosomal protein S20